MQKPSIGRIVHYVVNRGVDEGEDELEHVPAIVIEVKEDNSLRLAIFYWTGTMYCGSVECDETGEKSHTWHWPERVE